MTASVATVVVPTSAQMQQAIMSYVAQGFVVSTQTGDTTTLFKKQEFNILWAVIGFFLCLLPLLIYCIVYAVQKDQMVVIRVDPNAPATPALTMTGSSWQPSNAATVQWSDDRHYWWDGQTWIDAEKMPPPGAQLSPDGLQWWDGTAWRSLPNGTQLSSTTTNTPTGDSEENVYRFSDAQSSEIHARHVRADELGPGSERRVHREDR